MLRTVTWRAPIWIVEPAGARTRSPGGTAARWPFISITEPLVEDRSRIHKPDSPVPNSRCVLDTERVSSARVMRCSNRSPVAGAGARPIRPAPRTPTAEPSSNSSHMRGRCCGAMTVGPAAMSTMTSSFCFRMVGPSRSFSRVWLLTPACSDALARRCARLRMLSVTGVAGL